MVNLCFAKCFIQAHEEIGRSEIAVILGNFVLEDQMIAESIPRKFRYQAMVLMQISAIVSEDEIRLKLCPNGLKEFLDRFSFVREVAVAETPHLDPGAIYVFKKHARRLKSLPFSRWTRTENDPIKLKLREFSDQTQDRPAAADLDIIAMGS
jgi:hypothetical protein